MRKFNRDLQATVGSGLCADRAAVHGGDRGDDREAEAEPIAAGALVEAPERLEQAVDRRGGDDGPVLATVSTASPLTVEVASHTSPPGALYRNALSSRLLARRSKRIGSPMVGADCRDTCHRNAAHRLSSWITNPTDHPAP